MKVNQTLWAVTDPMWGNPVVIPETVRALRDDAISAVLWMTDYGMYHGGSMFPLPEGTKGNWDAMRKQGFKLCQIKLNEVEYDDE